MEPKFHPPRISFLAGVALFTAALAIVPLLFVVAKSFELTPLQWINLWSTRVSELLFNTLSLAFYVAVCCAVLGVSSAWILARRRFPGDKLAVWLMALPLAIPTYVYAQIYMNLTERDGWINDLWQTMFNAQSAPQVDNVVGLTLILSLASFPYVFLLVRSALQLANPNLEEAARIHGLNPRQIFWRIQFPLLRPAMVAGLTFVILHVFSEFGAVQLLNYDTFTKEIYSKYHLASDKVTAAALSFVLVLFSLGFFMLDRFFRRRQRYYALGGQARHLKIKTASRSECVLIWSWLGLISFFSLGLPLLRLFGWSWHIENVFSLQLWQVAFNSMVLAFFVAGIATLMALPLVLYHKRKNNPLSQTYLHLSSVGFVLPGPVVAVGIAIFMIQVLPPLYGGFSALVLALVIRFFPLAIQTEEAALQQLTPSIEQAARNLGASAFETIQSIIIPLIRPGLASAWVLVFIDALKELPASFILRPIGFETLPIRIWEAKSEEMLELAAPSALLLIAATLPAIWLIMQRQSFSSKP